VHFDCADDLGNGATMTWRSEGGLRYRILDDDNVIIAEVDTEEHARLIAAAPELLEALKEILARSGFNQGEWRAARAAIAKAEGRDA